MVSPNPEYQCFQGNTLEREESDSWISLDRFHAGNIESANLTSTLNETDSILILVCLFSGRVRVVEMILNNL